MPDDIGGVPTHPLIVHIPVVMVPLALLAVIAYFFGRSWRRPLVWVAAVLSGGGALGAVLAASSGESLRDRVTESHALEDHAEMGETARLLAFIFFLLVIALVVYEEIRSRRDRDGRPDGKLVDLASHRFAYPLIAVLVLISGATAVVSLVVAGHEGAKVTWQKVSQGP